MSRPDVSMTAEEVADFLAQERTLICATIGPRGWPHLMPLWYALREGTVWAWTFAKSQKVRNLERDPRATIQVESGERYEELRGVMRGGLSPLHCPGRVPSPARDAARARPVGRRS